MLQSCEEAGGEMIVAAGGGSVQVQVSSITRVQHVPLTSWTYIYNPSLMIFSPNLARFHSAPLWSAICILAPTGWKLFGWDFFFFFSSLFSPSLPSFLHLLTHPFTIPGARKLIPPSFPHAPSVPPSPRPSVPHHRHCAAQDLLLISAVPPERNKQISWREKERVPPHLCLILGVSTSVAGDQWDEVASGSGRSTALRYTWGSL